MICIYIYYLCVYIHNYIHAYKIYATDTTDLFHTYIH